ncbi:hypothetical protein ABZP36_033072 [Zizania latifolia]
MARRGGRVPQGGNWAVRQIWIVGRASEEAIAAGYNFVFSPPAIHTLLALVVAQARGATLQELLKFLGYNLRYLGQTQGGVL